jgi:hypothetical protein
MRELNEQIEKQKRHEAEYDPSPPALSHQICNALGRYARWQKVKARDEGRLKELAG